MRYVIFAGSFYYPSGGIGDLLHDEDGNAMVFYSIEEAKEVKLEYEDWGHIFDLLTLKVVANYMDNTWV